MLSFFCKSKHISMQTLQQKATPTTYEPKGIASTTPGKTSFLVFKHNKYFIVPTDNIAFFYVKHESSTIVCFDLQEYFVNYSLENIQNLLTEKQFFRLNR